jgi:1,4-dihydroxy-6-naphthoate synthase
MYVNDFTVDYGPVGERAVTELLERGARAGIISVPVDLQFISASP